MTEASARPSSRVALIVGVAAFAGGLWLLLNAMGVGVPPFKKLWPALLLIASAAALVDYLLIKRLPSSAGWMVAFLGFGVLGFAITLGYTDVTGILDWLPSFPTIAGLAMLTTWAAGNRESTNLPVAGLVLVGLGLVGFGARFDVLQKILPSVQVIWAILFLVVGGWLVWRYAIQAKGE